MNSKFIYVIVALLLIGGLVLKCVGAYNGFVSSEQNVNKEWGNVETQYQRRADLIPNLVETVKGYAKHEQETFTAVTAARAKATSINISADDLTEENIAKFQQAQNELSKGLGRLLASVESYPDLKANQNFLDLQAQLEGTENRIAKARSDYNEVVREYNTSIRKFPNNIIAGFTGFTEKPYIKAEEGAEKAPKVSF